MFDGNELMIISLWKDCLLHVHSRCFLDVSNVREMHRHDFVVNLCIWPDTLSFHQKYVAVFSIAQNISPQTYMILFKKKKLHHAFRKMSEAKCEFTNTVLCLLLHMINITMTASIYNYEYLMNICVFYYTSLWFVIDTYLYITWLIHKRYGVPFPDQTLHKSEC